jgi:hypothetical protein
MRKKAASQHACPTCAPFVGKWGLDPSHSKFIDMMQVKASQISWRSIGNRTNFRHPPAQWRPDPEYGLDATEEGNMYHVPYWDYGLRPSRSERTPNLDFHGHSILWNPLGDTYEKSEATYDSRRLCRGL